MPRTLIVPQNVELPKAVDLVRSHFQHSTKEQGRFYFVHANLVKQTNVL